MKKLKSIIAILAIIIIVIVIAMGINNSKTELLSVKTKYKLEQIYEGDSGFNLKNIGIGMLTMPFSLSGGMFDDIYYDDIVYSSDVATPSVITPSTMKDSTGSLAMNKTESTSATSGASKDYSTTNIQVENVDEADITKTDGDYIYSISESKVIVTDARDASNIKIVSTIEAANSSTVIPEELILQKNKLAIIYTETKNNSSYYNSKNNTIVKIYDMQDKEEPKLLKEYTLYEPYYTSRCIDNKLYVISSGSLRKEDDKIVVQYKEDNQTKEIDLNNIKYLKDINTKNQTLISMVDLENVKDDVNINSYLLNIQNAYVSESNIYLLNQRYISSNIKISSIFGLGGIIGAFSDDNFEDSYYGTEIYKFNILEDGTIKYDTKTSEKGRTIDQFSLDEYNNNLRVAMYDNDGSRVVVFNEKLEKIGETEKLAEGERMYSSRFVGEKAYLVTYKTIDPLFVIDLSDPSNPQSLGELKIPGYSTYLHPYDENHIIGIGMQTEEVINRNSYGKVTSTTAKIVGMKMALFDVSDVNNPVQISETVIGDSRTTSAILTNHKALLFSKEKELIAIPVNNYKEDFEVETSSEDYSSIISSYKNNSKDYVAEGYFVYNINTTDGFELKGVINHEKTKNRYYYNNSKLLRGMYIENNLFTVSEGAIKVNRLDNLELISELKIKED